MTISIKMGASRDFEPYIGRSTLLPRPEYTYLEASSIFKDMTQALTDIIIMQSNQSDFLTEDQLLREAELFNKISIGREVHDYGSSMFVDSSMFVFAGALIIVGRRSKLLYCINQSKLEHYYEALRIALGPLDWAKDLRVNLGVQRVTVPGQDDEAVLTSYLKQYKCLDFFFAEGATSQASFKVIADIIH